MGTSGTLGVGLLGRANPNPVLSVALVGETTGNDIVAGVANKKIKVLSFILTNTTAAGAVQFEDGATNYTGDMETDTGPIVAPYNEAGWFTVATGLGLDITVGAGAIEGVLTYVLVD